MWMALLLGTITGVGRAQVSTARVIRGNIRRDGELSSSLLSFCDCCAVAVFVSL